MATNNIGITPQGVSQMLDVTEENPNPPTWTGVPSLEQIPVGTSPADKPKGGPSPAAQPKGK